MARFGTETCQDTGVLVKGHQALGSQGNVARLSPSPVPRALSLDRELLSGPYVPSTLPGVRNSGARERSRKTTKKHRVCQVTIKMESSRGWVAAGGGCYVR